MTANRNSFRGSAPIATVSYGPWPTFLVTKVSLVRPQLGKANDRPGANYGRIALPHKFATMRPLNFAAGTGNRRDATALTQTPPPTA